MFTEAGRTQKPAEWIPRRETMRGPEKKIRENTEGRNFNETPPMATETEIAVMRHLKTERRKDSASFRV